MKKQTLENFKKNKQGVMDKNSLNSVTGGFFWIDPVVIAVVADAASEFYKGFKEGWNSVEAED